MLIQMFTEMISKTKIKRLGKLEEKIKVPVTAFRLAKKKQEKKLCDQNV